MSVPDKVLTFAPSLLKHGKESLRAQLFIQNREILNSQKVAESILEQRIQPPEDGPVIETSGGLRGIGRKLGLQNVSLLHSLKNKNHSFDGHSHSRDDCNDLIERIRGPKPQGPGSCNIEKQAAEQVCVQNKRGSDRSGMLGI